MKLLTRTKKQQVKNPPNIYKMMILGIAGSGVTTLTRTFIWECYYDDPTIEDSYRKRISIDNEQVVLEVLDLGSYTHDEAGGALRKLCMKDREGFMLVYSITSRESFQELDAIRSEILDSRNGSAVPFVLVANKSDLEAQRVVSRQEGEELARSLGCPYLTTNATIYHDAIRDPFEQMVREIRKSREIARTASVEQQGERQTTRSLGDCSKCMIL